MNILEAIGVARYCFYIQGSLTQQPWQQICGAKALLENCHPVPTYKAIPTRKCNTNLLHVNSKIKTIFAPSLIYYYSKLRAKNLVLLYQPLQNTM